MQVEELIGFLDWLDQEVRKTKLTDLYKQLSSVLSKNAAANQSKEPFEDQRTKLIEAVLNVRIELLNDSQKRFAENIGLLSLVGPKAKDIIEDTLYKNYLDIATAANKIKEFHDSLNAILKKMAQVSEGLKEYFDASPPDYQEALVHIRFQYDSSINNIVDLKKWGNAWHEIARGITLAFDLPPEEVKVVGASRGSLVYDFAVGYIIAKMLTSVTLGVLKVAERALDIRKKAEEIRMMKLSNDKAAKELESEAERIEKEGCNEVLDVIKKERKLDGEQETAMTNAINKIFEFLSGGGIIDVHIKKPTDDDDTEEKDQQDKRQLQVDIEETYKEIERLQNKLLLLQERNE